MTILGILLPESVLESRWYAVLAAFVLMNTVMYVTLATVKTLPVIRPLEWFRPHRQRARNRSIYPDVPAAPHGDEARDAELS
ncbi:hypothetical protein [Mariniluteicoccus flavus]